MIRNLSDLCMFFFSRGLKQSSQTTALARDHLGSGGLWQLWAASLCQATLLALGRETWPSYFHSVPGMNTPPPSPPLHTHLNFPQHNRRVTKLQKGLGIKERKLSLKSHLRCWQRQTPEAHLTRALISAPGAWFPRAEPSSHLLPENSGPTVR